MLGTKTQEEENYTKIFLNIDKEGRIVRTSKDGSKNYFDSVEGALQSITLKEREYSGEKVPVWYISLRDSVAKEDYILSLRYESGVFRSIILSIASLPSIEEDFIKIHPYQRDGYTKVMVYYGDSKLDWIKDVSLPPVESIEVGGRTYKDSSKREDYIKGIVAQVNGKITSKNK